MAAVDLACPVPNNVGLAEKPELRRSLEWFDLQFRKWWLDCGPAGIRNNEVYPRTPVGVDAGGWAQYGFVPLSQYRWGVFQASAKPGRLALFGEMASGGSFADSIAEAVRFCLSSTVVYHWRSCARRAPTAFSARIKCIRAENAVMVNSEDGAEVLFEIATSKNREMTNAKVGPFDLNQPMAALAAVGL